MATPPFWGPPFDTCPHDPIMEVDKAPSVHSDDCGKEGNSPSHGCLKMEPEGG